MEDGEIDNDTDDDQQHYGGTEDHHKHLAGAVAAARNKIETYFQLEKLAILEKNIELLKSNTIHTYHFLNITKHFELFKRHQMRYNCKPNNRLG